MGVVSEPNQWVSSEGVKKKERKKKYETVTNHRITEQN